MQQPPTQRLPPQPPMHRSPIDEDEIAAGVVLAAIAGYQTPLPARGPAHAPPPAPTHAPGPAPAPAPGPAPAPTYAPGHAPYTTPAGFAPREVLMATYGPVYIHMYMGREGV